MINKTVKDIAIGRIIQLDDKYFFIKTQYAGLVLPDGPPTVKLFDEDELMKQALQKYPETEYFNMRADYKAFDPDEKYDWLR